MRGLRVTSNVNCEMIQNAGCIVSDATQPTPNLALQIYTFSAADIGTVKLGGVLHDR